MSLSLVQIQLFLPKEFVNATADDLKSILWAMIESC